MKNAMRILLAMVLMLAFTAGMASANTDLIQPDEVNKREVLKPAKARDMTKSADVETALGTLITDTNALNAKFAQFRQDLVDAPFPLYKPLGALKVVVEDLADNMDLLYDEAGEGPINDRVSGDMADALAKAKSAYAYLFEDPLDPFILQLTNETKGYGDNVVNFRGTSYNLRWARCQQFASIEEARAVLSVFRYPDGTFRVAHGFLKKGEDRVKMNWDRVHYTKDQLTRVFKYYRVCNDQYKWLECGVGYCDPFSLNQYNK